MLRLINKLGELTLYYVNMLGRMGVFLVLSIIGIFRPPYKLFPILKQINSIGSQSIFVIAFTGAFTGAVLALQGYYTLRQFGSVGLLGSAVALSLIRELGPVLSALMVTGRAGSAICAEIGIMRISEQIDALDCMAIDPYRYLIAPKFVASLISLPALNFIFNIVGIAGGYVVGVLILGVNSGAFFSGMEASVTNDDIFMGALKSFAFGLLIVWICSARGFFVHLDRAGGFGAEGVSRATTNAVVLSSVAVLVFDYLLTAILI